MEWLIDYARSLAALVLLLAALTKLGERATLANVIYNYGLVSYRLSRWAARILPEAEAALAIMLLTGGGTTVAGPAAAVLFLLFAVAVGVNLVRGRSSIACGCFGPDGHSASSWAHVAQNLVFASGAAVAAPSLRAASGVPPHAVAVPSATLAAAVTIACWWLGSLALRTWKTASIDAEWT